MSRSVMLYAVVLSSCSGPETSTDSNGTDDTSAIAHPGALVPASCAAQADNVLRYDCLIERETAGAVTVTVTSVDGMTREFTSDASETLHEVTLWGLAEDTVHDWVATMADEAGQLDGSFTTSAVPSSASLSTEISGTGVFDGLLVRNCDATGVISVINPAGQTIWYEDMAAHIGASSNAEIDGYSYTDDGGFVAILNQTYVVEVAATGALRLSLDVRDLGLTGLLHHDVYKRDGLIYTLYAFEEDGLVLDGVYILSDAGELVGELDTTNAFNPGTVVSGESGGGGAGGGGFWSQEFPGAEEVAHANSVFADAQGDVLVSFRYLSSIVMYDGDPASADFGSKVWAIVGGDAPAFDSDFDITSSVTGDLAFEDEHCAQISPNGRVTLFDNGDRGDASRGLVMELDDASGTADIVGAYEVGESCDVQSGMYELHDESVLVTCASSTRVMQFEAGVSAPVWELDITCEGSGGGMGGGPGSMIPRGIPVTF